MWLLYRPSLMLPREKGSLYVSFYAKKDGGSPAVISYAFRVEAMSVSGMGNPSRASYYVCVCGVCVRVMVGVECRAFPHDSQALCY
jgi:hypothetical protein